MPKAVPNHLGVGCVLTFHQKAQRHDVAYQPRADQRRAEFVADISGATHQVFFLPDACPARRQQIQPDVVRIERQAFAQGRQVADAVVMHHAAGQFAQPLRWQRQPIGDGQRLVVVPTYELPQRHTQHAMLNWTCCGRLHVAHPWLALGFRSPDGIASELMWQGVAQVFLNRGRERGVLIAQEDADHRTPIMVGGHRRVEAQHIAAAADAGGGMCEVGETLV